MVPSGVTLLCAALLLVAAAQPDPATLAARAKAALEAQRFDEAIALYQKLARTFPEEPGLRMNLGIALHAAGRYREAVTELTPIAQRHPDLLPASLVLGLSHLKLGETARAVAPLARVVAADPANRVARLELADACLTVGRHNEAATHFRALTALEPQSAKGWYGLTLSYAWLARDAFERLEQVAPDSAWWHYLVAESRADQHQYRSAFAHYRQALSKNPGLRDAHEAIVRIYERTGHADWAAAERERARRVPAHSCDRAPLACAFESQRYEQVIAQPDTSNEGLFWAARAYTALALRALATLEQLPPSVELHAARAGAYRVRGQHQLAVREWEAALALAPNDRRAERELARSLWLNRDYEAARPRLEALLRRDPDAGDLNYELGETLLEQQQPDRAIPLLERAVARAPDLLAARATLGRAHLVRGDTARAIPHLEAALAADRDGSVHFQLSRAYAAAGRQAHADETMQKYKALAEGERARRERVEVEQEITPP